MDSTRVTGGLRRAALWIAVCPVVASCGGGDWHSNVQAFESAYYACASSSGCSSAKRFRDASVTWQGKLVEFDPADGTVTLGMNEAKAPKGLNQIACCFGLAKHKSQWAAIPMGQTVTFRATIGKGSLMFAALEIGGSAIVYLGVADHATAGRLTRCPDCATLLLAGRLGVAQTNGLRSHPRT